MMSNAYLRRRYNSWVEVQLVLTAVRNVFAQRVIEAPDLATKMSTASHLVCLQKCLSLSTSLASYYGAILPPTSAAVRRSVILMLLRAAGGQVVENHVSAILHTARALIDQVISSLDGVGDGYSLPSAHHINRTLAAIAPKEAVSLPVIDCNEGWSSNLVLSHEAFEAVFPKSETLPRVPARQDGCKIAVGGAYTKPPDILANRLYSQAYCTEVPAAEVCAMMLLRFREVPDRLQCDLVLQIADELRHATMLLDKYDDCKDARTGIPVHFAIWENALQAETLGEAIMIEQVLGEGYGIGNDLFLAAHYRTHGRGDLADMHLAIHADEANHVRRGILWSRRLLGLQASSVLSSFEDRMAPTVLGGKWFLRSLRARVGFTEDEIDRQRRRSRVKRLPHL